jgi:uncharacterized protein
MLEILVMLLLVLPATALLLSLPSRVKEWKFRFHALEFINTQSKYQLTALGLGLGLVVLLWVLFPRQLLRFLSFGNPSAASQGMPLFGVGAGESWLGVGLSFSVFITLATGIFMYLGFRQFAAQRHKLPSLLPWILAFSASNAFIEEVIYRLAVVVPLEGKLEPSLIALCSGVLFGLPHLRGMPSGLLGAAMSGVLGYILCTSLLETGGLVWAWWIHFLQDVVIFSALVLQASAEKPK